MNKKFFIFFIVLLLLPVALAEELSESQIRMQQRTSLAKNDYNITITGLNNAILKVRSNETREHLETVLNKIMAKRNEQILKLQNLSMSKINNETILEGQQDVKFLGLFKIKKQARYTVQDDGTLVKKKKWNDFLYRESV